MKLAIIPARGGSKRIPRKNIRPFRGKPIIAWSIEAAREAGLFNRIIVSTDDEEIAAVARDHGAETPFMRPAAIADDRTGVLAVVEHAIDWFVDQGQPVSHACCVYATAPFVRADDIRAAWRLLQEHGARYALPVTTFPFPIQRALRVGQDGRVEMFAPEHLMTRSQDLEEAWHDAGQFFWATAQAVKGNAALFGPGTVAHPVPRWRVQDIDTEEDWTRAELLHDALARREKRP
jgi:pseudaminic acid cytidylyltransferase